MIPWTLFCFVQRDYRQAMFLIILYVVCLVARQFLQPKMIADSMGLDSMATLVLIYTGYKLNGMKGMILALYEYRHCGADCEDDSNAKL